MPEQLAFDLPVRTSRDRGDFFLSEANALAVARLDASGTWPNGKLVLTGPEGSGKSHLASAWAEEHGTTLITPADLTGRVIPEIDHVCAIDLGADTRMTAAEEEALFHLHNHLAASGLPLLLVARQAPARWPIALADLKSRLEAAEVVRIDEPDDALLAAVLVKLFSDRQIDVSPNLIGWLVPRIDRSFAAAQDIVSRLDAAALAAQKPVSRELARRTLDNPPD